MNRFVVVFCVLWCVRERFSVGPEQKYAFISRFLQQWEYIWYKIRCYFWWALCAVFEMRITFDILHLHKWRTPTAIWRTWSIYSIGTGVLNILLFQAYGMVWGHSCWGQFRISTWHLVLDIVDRLACQSILWYFVSLNFGFVVQALAVWMASRRKSFSVKV